MTHKYDYLINGGTQSERKVSADSYGHQDGYFHFVDSDKVRVFSIQAGHVITVERSDAK